MKFIRNALLEICQKEDVTQYFTAKGKLSMVTALDHVPNIPRLSWLNLKTRKSSIGNRKNRPGRLQEHIEALAQMGSQVFAQAVDKVFREKKAEAAAVTAGDITEAALADALPATVPAPNLGEITQ